MEAKYFFLKAVLFCLLLQTVTLHAEIFFDTKGNDFWFAFPPNYHNNKNPYNEQKLLADSIYIYIAADEPTSGVIEYYDTSSALHIHNFVITDINQVYKFGIPAISCEIIGYNDINSNWEQHETETPIHRTFHISSEKDINVYTLNRAETTSDAMLVMPTDVLGYDYFIMSYYSDDGQASKASRTPSQFIVVAVEDSTTVDIFPKTHTYMHPSTLPFQIVLNKGECYLVQAEILDIQMNNDLTGSYIHSDKPIAVFAGHQRARVPVTSTNRSRDCLIEQMPPLNTWGKNAFITPLHPSNYEDTSAYDIYRLVAGYDNTNIYMNGILTATLNTGDFYEDRIINPIDITSNKPFITAVIKKSYVDNLGSDRGDPFLMMVPPKEQFIKSCRVINSQGYNYSVYYSSPVFSEHYITVIVKKDFAASVKIDRLQVDQSKFLPIGSSDYLYGNFSVEQGVHTVEADDKIGVYVYGYGAADSYGYIGGMSMTPFDVTPPEIFVEYDCFEIEGFATEVNIHDSGIVDIFLDTDSVENLKYFQYHIFEYCADSLFFYAESLNPRLDGSFILSITDSIGLVTTKKIYIPGITIAPLGCKGSETAPVIDYFIPVLMDTTLSMTITNFGHFSREIIGITNTNPLFEYFNLPKNIILDSGDVYTFTFKCNDKLDSLYIDTLKVNTDCGEIVLAIIRLKIINSDCDVTAFDYSDFLMSNGIQTVREAAIYSGIAHLTRSNLYEIGAIWYKYPVKVINGFVSEFEFSMNFGSNGNTIEHSSPGADGIAFVLQSNSPNLSGAPGGGIGYDGLLSALAIEFDTYNNDSTQLDDYFDPNGNHAAILMSVNDTLKAKHLNNVLGVNTDILPLIADGRHYYAKIEYNIKTKELTVYIDSIKSFSIPTLIVTNFDITDYIPLLDNEKTYVGITSATGAAMESHNIHAWRFCPTPINPINDVDEATTNEYLKITPNPVTDYAEVEFEIKSPANVRLFVSNLSGETVVTLKDGFTADLHNVIGFSTKNLSQGTYYLMLTCNDETITLPFVVLKR